MSKALKRQTKHPKALALARDATQRQLRRWFEVRSAVIVAIWIAVSVVLGVGMSAGALVHAGWLTIMSIALLLSPLALVGLRRANTQFKEARLALAEAEEERAVPDHLHGALAHFYAETRVARVGLSDAVEPGEGVRMLFEWRHSFENLPTTDRERLAELGVGLGPIAALLVGVESDEALSDEQRHEAATQLGHVESLLGEVPGGVYR